jgi:plastocyanin
MLQLIALSRECGTGCGRRRSRGGGTGCCGRRRRAGRISARATSLHLMRWALVFSAVVIWVGTASARAATVTIQNGPCSPVPSGTEFCFSPPSQTASPGEQVTWTNSSVAPHAIARCDPANCNGVGGGTGSDSWSGSSTINPGTSYANTFTGPGTYVYYCTIHRYSAMHGTITVLAPDTPPTASFSITPASPTVGQPVTLDGSASRDSDGDTIATYRWDFGDGSTNTSTTSTVAHSYASPGVMTVKLVVVDSHGTQSAAAVKTVTVGRPPPAVATKLRLRTGRLCARKTPTCRHTTTRLTFTLSRADRVSVVIKRRAKLIRRRTLRGKARKNSLPFSVAGLQPGRYKLILTPLGGRAIRATFTVT